MGAPGRAPSLAVIGLPSDSFDDVGAALRGGEAARQYFLVLRRVVPALDRGAVGKFEDDDAFRFRAALDQFARSAPREEAAAILRERGGDGRAVKLQRRQGGEFEFGNEIGRHRVLPL